MTFLKAKPVLEDKFWIVENEGQRVATLRKDEFSQFVFQNKDGVKIYNNKKSVTREFGDDFFVAKIVKEADDSNPKEVHGFSTSTIPHNAMYDIRQKLPLFTKSKDSKSLYCAGYYVIRFEKGWVKSFCPKLITLQRYGYKGPFKTDLEMKQVLSSVNK
tara:strand:- start:1353 stop:1829 length:477 start_codon:yes stop_codon:yes gene_type:complete